MAQGLTITDEQRAQLSPDILSLVDEYDERFGAGNSVSHNLVSSFFEEQAQPAQVTVAPDREQLAPDAPPRGLGTTQTQISQATANAIEVRTKEIAFEESIDFTEARQKAMKEIGEVRQKFESTTADGKRHVRGYTEEDILTAPSAGRALLRSMGTQSVTVGKRPEERVAEETGLEEKEIDALRSRIVVDSKVKARKIAKDQGLEWGSDEFDKVVDREFAKIAANELRLFYRDLYKIQKAVVLSENNLDPSADFPEDMKDDLQAEARERTTSYYDFVTPLVFEGLGQVLGPSGVPLVPNVESQSYLRGLTERERKGGRGLWQKTKDSTALMFYSNYHQFDPTSGEVSESWLGAGIRDVGLLLPRIVSYPVMRAVTWDMDPATGKPLDSDDPAYKMSRLFDRLIPEAMQDGLKFIQQASLIGNLLPVGQGYALDKHANTGSVIRDLAYSHSKGELLSEDYGNLSHALEMQRRGALPHWYDELSGFAVEVFIPGKVLTAPIKLGKTTLGTTAKGLSGVARSAKADNVAEVFDAVRTWSNSSESLGDALVLQRLQKEVYEEAGIRLTKPATIRGAVEAPDKIADMMSADLAAKLLTVDRAEDIRKVFAGVKEGSFLDQVINESFSTLVDFRNIKNTDRNSKLFRKKIADLSKYKRGRELIAEMRIAAAAKRLRPGIPDKVLAQRVVQGVMKNPIRRFTAEHIPDNFVFAGDSPLIVRKDVWMSNQDKINKSLRRKLGTDIVVGTTAKGGKESFLRFKNGKEAADLAMKGFQRSNYAPALVKAIDKVRKGQAITRDQYNVVRSLAPRSLIIDELPASAMAVQGVGTDIATSALSKKAALLGQGRDLTVHRYIERAVKGTRSFFNGKSDYSYLVGNPGKKGFFRPQPNLFGNTPAPELAEWNSLVTARLNNAAVKVDEMIMEAIRKSGDGVSGMNRVLRRVSTGDQTTDYIDILNLFYGIDGGLEKWVGTNNNLRKMLKAEGLPPVSIDGVKQAIAAVRKRAEGKFAFELEKSVVKKKAWYGRLTGEDDLSALLSAHVTRKILDEIYTGAVKSFEDLYPGFLVKTPSKGDAAARIEIFKDIAKTNGIEPELADEMAKVVAKSFKANDSDRRSIAEAIVGVMFKDGKLATQDDLVRMYEAAVEESVTGIIGQWKGGSIHNMRTALKDFIEKNPGSPTLMELERVLVPAYVKAVAGLDMNDIRGIFSGLGVKSAAGERTLIGGALGSQKFGDNGLLFFDSRLADLAEKMGKVDSTAKIEEALGALRHAQRVKGAGLLDAWQTTRRTTITGILGGSIMQGTRFLGLNALTNFMIGAITVPGYALNMALKTPSGVAQAYVKAFRKTGGIGRPGAYNPYKMMYAGDDTTIMFTTANGKTWTKQMLDDAAQKHSLRFSQVTFEFGFDTLQNTMRASKLGPKGQSVEGLLHIPGQGRVGRQRFWEFLRPDKKTVWSSVAEELDNVQRMSVFSEALRVGMKESDAAALARASLLDYANVGDGAVRSISKHMAFFAFRYNMAVETMSAFLRDGKALNNMAGILNVINNQRTDMEEWVLEPDWMKTRLWKNYNGKFREWVAGSLGPDIPFSQPWGMMTNFFGFFMDSKYRESFSGSEIISEGFRGLLSDPRFQAMFDIDALKSTGSAPNGYMPPAYLSAAATFGLEDELISLFDLERVPDSQARQDIGFVNGRQYRFQKGDDLLHFKLFQLGALITGQKRALEDVPRILASMGVEQDGVDWRKEALGGMLFGFGGSMGSFRDAPAALDKIEQQLFLELRDIGKRPSTDE